MRCFDSKTALWSALLRAPSVAGSCRFHALLSTPHHFPCSPSSGEHITRPPYARAPPSQKLRGIRCFQTILGSWSSLEHSGELRAECRAFPPSWSTRRGGGSVYDFRPQPTPARRGMVGDVKSGSQHPPACPRWRVRQHAPETPDDFAHFAARNSWKAPPPPPGGAQNPKLEFARPFRKQHHRQIGARASAHEKPRRTPSRLTWFPAKNCASRPPTTLEKNTLKSTTPARRYPGRTT